MSVALLATPVGMELVYYLGFNNGSLAQSSATLTLSATHLTSSILSITSTPSAVTRQSSSVTSSTAGFISSDATNFSGRSFVTGFIPGILFGAGLLALLLVCLRRQYAFHDQDSTVDNQRPIHRRQISNPIVHPQHGERTAFIYDQYKRQPAEDPVPYGEQTAVGVEPAMSDKFRVSSLFHKSPNSHGIGTTSSPMLTSLPVSLRRGSITPPRFLRTKQGNHSLRRQLPDYQPASEYQPAVSRKPSDASHGSQQPNSIRHQTSQETINIQMSLPREPSDRSVPTTWPLFPRSKNKDVDKAGLWLSYRLPPEPATARVKDTTLYTPSKYGNQGGNDTPIGARGNRSNRTTTFGDLMERAVIRRSELLGRAF
ncbi:hypothetical protein MBLNU457_g2908t1 [Dothideomycetes sp. NU457]